MRECGNAGMWGCGDVGMWGCGDVGMWECGNVGMRECGNVGMRECGDAGGRWSEEGFNKLGPLRPAWVNGETERIIQSRVGGRQ